MSQMEWNSMLPSLISHNEDLQKIQDAGISFDVRSGNFVADCVPYLTESKEIKAGILVFPMNMENMTIKNPNDHTAFFIGSKPCEMDGTPIKGLGILEMQQPLFDNIKSDYRFSCYPDKGMYPTYYDKVLNYWRVITAPAENTDKAACLALKKQKLVRPVGSKLVYWDINSSRAHIAGLTDMFKGMKIAIVGLGGTGSYVLDFISKLPLDEIHLFDSDIFEQHNAFRAPGAASSHILEQHITKVQYLSSVYKHMNEAIVPHAENINPNNKEILLGMDFIFLCIDNAAVRNEIANFLIKNNKKFVNSGIGVSLREGGLSGIIRISYGESGHYHYLNDAFSATNEAGEDDIYRDNIQIAELNAFAAMESVFRWKQSLGFYQDSARTYDLEFVMNKNKIIYDDPKV